MAVLIGMTLFVYNDWRTHRTFAAPQTPAHAQPHSTESPLQLPDQGVKGTIQVGPNGDIKQVGE